MSMVRLVNVGKNQLYLHEAPFFNNLKLPPGHAIDVPDAALGSSQVTSAFQNGWLAQMPIGDAPTAMAPIPTARPSTVARVSGGVVAGPGSHLDAPQYGRDIISYPGAGGSDAVNLPGFVPRMPEIDEDTARAPQGISNAASIITGRPVQDINTPQVPAADAMIRQNTPAPQYREMPGPVAADSIMRQAFVPHQAAQNFAVGQPGFPATGEAGGVTRSGPGQIPVPVPQQPYPTAPQYTPPAPNVSQQVPPGYQIVRHPGGGVSLQPIPMAPMQPQPPMPGRMGFQVPYSALPMQREPVDIESMADAMPANIEATTDAILNDSKRKQQVAAVLTNYREMDINKRLYTAMNSTDLEILTRLLAMETSGILGAQIQNRIVQLGGQIPDPQQMQMMRASNANVMLPQGPMPQMPVMAPSLLAPVPQAPVVNPVKDAIYRYATQMSDQEKADFLSRMTDPDVLNQLLKIETSDVIRALIGSRITQAQAAVQAAESAPQAAGRPTPPAAEIIVDKKLPPPPIPGCTCGNLVVQGSNLVFTMADGQPTTQAPDGKIQCPKCGGWMEVPKPAPALTQATVAIPPPNPGGGPAAPAAPGTVPTNGGQA